MNSPDTDRQESESLGDVIADQFDKMESEAEEVEETEESAEAETDEQEPVEAEGEEAETEEDGEEESEQLAQEVEDAADSDYTEPAPERWPEDIRKVYNELPPPARKAMLEGIYKPMQRSYTQATTELAQMRQYLSPMMEVLEQYRGELQSSGVDPVEAFRSQMAWAAHFQRVGAEQGLRDMAAAYGNADAQGQEYDTLTPNERGLKLQIDALQQQVQGQNQRAVQQQQQQAFATQQNEIRNELVSFINEKTDDGKPAHPHVEKVASNIAGIIRGGLVRDADEYGNPVPIRDKLAQAYQMACDLDPTIRTPSNTGRQAQRAAAAQKVDVVRTEPAGHLAEEEDMSNMTDFISRQYDKMNRRSA